MFESHDETVAQILLSTVQLCACSIFTWPFVTEWWLALCGMTIALILSSLFCTVCTTLNVVNTDISSLPYTNEDSWKVGFAYARRKPLYAVVARSYRRTRFIVNICVLTPFITEYHHLRLIIGCEPPFWANKLHVLWTRSTQWNFNLWFAVCKHTRYNCTTPCQHWLIDAFTRGDSLWDTNYTSCRRGVPSGTLTCDLLYANTRVISVRPPVSTDWLTDVFSCCCLPLRHKLHVLLTWNTQWNFKFNLWFAVCKHTIVRLPVSTD